MKITEISKEEFDNFSINYPLTSYYQTSAYGDYQTTLGYTSIYIGAYENNVLVAASLLLSKSISINSKYAYAPRGFLCDYANENNINQFIKALKKYFNKKGFVFIKTDPLVTYSVINPENEEKTISSLAVKINELLENNNFKKLKDNIYFESILPKFNPIVNLSQFEYSNLSNHEQDLINTSTLRGLRIIKGSFEDLEKYYNLQEKKKDLKNYQNLFTAFDKDNKIDLLLVELDYHKYLLNIQEEFIIETTINEKINNLFQLDTNNKEVYLEKMNSDKRLQNINKIISDINNTISTSTTSAIIAGALIIKHGNVVTIHDTSLNPNYTYLKPMYFLYNSIINIYKNQGIRFLDLNGIAGDFTKDNPYKDDTDFKLTWNPKIYEYLGEYDLLINQTKYSLLWSSKVLQKEFEKDN